jgi:glycosyltransferase involved in cell wall biosynthesis
MPPEVSIVIPHFNRLSLIQQTLESVRGSRSASYEVIVVDDGSDARCRHLLASLAAGNVRVIDNEGLKGPSGARNTGAREADGELLVFLDSDDLLAPWCLAQRMKSANDFPENDLWIFPVLLFHEQPGDRAILWNDMERGDDAIRFLQSDPPWHTSSPIWRRAAFLELGGFNERVIYGDDTDLHVRALINELRLAKFPDALPDVFVRRSNVDRITAGMKPEVVESRVARLSEMSNYLRARGSAGLAGIFEGQYFAEAEFLLFNAEKPAGRIARVLDRWRSDYPSSNYRALATAYLELSAALRDKSYLAVRVLRRFAHEVLPSTFFPTAGGIETTPVDPAVMRRLIAELNRAA